MSLKNRHLYFSSSTTSQSTEANRQAYLDTIFDSVARKLASRPLRAYSVPFNKISTVT